MRLFFANVRAPSAHGPGATRTPEPTVAQTDAALTMGLRGAFRNSQDSSAKPGQSISRGQSATAAALFLRRHLSTLEHALSALDRTDPDDVAYDIFRAACVKEFEIVLEQSGKLLRKRLAPFFASNRQADHLVFKDIFRHAARHGLIEPAAWDLADVIEEVDRD